MRRAPAIAPVLTWLLLGSLAAACGDDPPVEQKKALLRPDENRRRRAEELESRRIFDAKGELIPSGQELGELELPKGLKVYRQLEREHYLEAPRITLEQLERYFGPRVEPMGVERTATSVTYTHARIKGRASAPPVTLRIARVVANEPACDVLLRMAPPPRVFPTEAQLQAELEKRRKYAN
jgi:hypothetical protein